ncbi:hypothetical protein V3851_23060 [Paenibacillus sp. M1]|uniref:Uncharacterized protein n=1 Tax=Paenibacillus haidiansis TaxID=1574488 RepID=A0ABU7VYX9_9BACL
MLLGVDTIPAFVPYLLLIVTSLILIAISWYKSKQLMLIPYYICISGIIYIFELFVYVIFDSYKYMPGVFKNAYYDSTLGAVVSNGFIIPSACAFIAVLGLGIWWILLIGTGFMGVEQLFIYLGIYEHHWWRTIFTGIGVSVLFLMGKWIWRKINASDKSYFFRLLLLYLINVSLQGSIMFFYIVLFHQIEYRIGWFDNPSRDNIALAALFSHIDSILFALVISLQAKWYWKAILIAGLGCFFLLLIRLEILFVTGIWSIITLILLLVVLLLLLSGLYNILTAKSGAHRHI